MNKKNVYALSFLLVPLMAYSQELEADFTEGEKIQLPEVTTVVTGDSLVAGKDAVPDFSYFLPDVAEDNVPLPELPQASFSEYAEEPVADLDYNPEKNVYAEGLIGGGFPGFFTGDFSVYKSSDDNPFLLRFFHNAQSGYGSYSAQDGYFDNNTLLHGEKTFSGRIFNCVIDGTYESLNYGLQTKSPAFYDLNYQYVSTDDKFFWNFAKGFSVGTEIYAEFYTRYSGLTDTGLSALLNQEKNIKVSALEPSLYAEWKNSFLLFNLNARYINELALTELSDPGSSYAGLKTNVVNRGDFNFNAAWHNPYVAVSARVGAVVGNVIGSVPVIVPFNIDFSGNWRLGSALRPFTLQVSGGLDSKKQRLSELERISLFTTNLYLTSETTDWFGLIKTSVPIGSFITIDAKSEFRTTAFGNGVWEGDYNDFYSTDGALYVLKMQPRTLLTLDASVSYLWNIFTVGANYKGNFIYVPVVETPHKIGLFIDYQAENTKWGFNAEVYECLGPDVDFVPLVNAGIFYKLRDSIRLAFELDDAIKLFTGSNRTFSSSEYKLKSGSCVLQVRFFF